MIAAATASHLTKRFGSADGGQVAVEDVSFMVEPGSAVSVVGPNGAGKSTLLKLIAGILTPTAGTIRRVRRCASVIELGAGFHPDLTGRENVDVGLALAGIPRRKRRSSRDAVIDFSGISEAVDRPVRHLSSGMLARLACAVAVQGAPDLLLLDEVLAVGDGEFQEQMLSTVDDLVTSGTALLLVTHSMQLALRATTRTVWLDDGRIVSDGEAVGVTSRYEAEARGWGHTADDHPLVIERLTVSPDEIEPGQPVRVTAEVACSADCGPLEVRVEARPTVGDDNVWMRSSQETPEMRHVNLVATTVPTTIERLVAGYHRLTVAVGSVPISPTTLEVTLTFADDRNRIIDQASVALEVGSDPRRPQYHLQASARPRPE